MILAVLHGVLGMFSFLVLLLDLIALVLMA